MNKKYKPTIRNRYIFLVDLVCIVISVGAAFVIRLEIGPLLNYYLPSGLWMIGVSLLVKPVVYYAFGLYRRMWVYASIHEIKQILVAVTTASIVVSSIVVILYSMKVFTGFPRSALVIDWLLSIILVGGVRFGTRVILESLNIASIKPNAQKAKRVLLIGAGDAGAMVIREMQKNPQLNLNPIGFLDDDPTKLKQQIYGKPVIGPLRDLAKVLDSQRVDEVVIAIPTAPGAVVRNVADVCRLKSVGFRTMPGLYELIGGKININKLREVEISDLLRREQVRVKDDRVGEVIQNRVVLVTGAGGSIGSEICRQISKWEPSVLVLLGHGENSIFEILFEMRESFPSQCFYPVICDIRDKVRLKQVFELHKPDVVFHAAAHKHVPLMEANIEDAITNNIVGTRNVVETCEEMNVDQLIMISTDKAIRPVNIMGATKNVAEMIVLDAAERSGRKFSVVRFGNVLGSRGSVVPIFKKQIAKGGPVTVTHPDMKRYFMTIPEAVYLVLQAASMGGSGKCYVLNMGQQVRILDLVEDLIRLSGLQPGKDIEIVFTGIRPGEKLSEDLWDESSSITPTSHPDVYCMECSSDMRDDELKELIDKLCYLTELGLEKEIVDLLDETIPGATVVLSKNLEMTSMP